VFSLFLIILVSLSEALWKGYLSLPVFQKAGYFLYPISFLLFFMTSTLFIVHEKLWRKCKKTHSLKIYALSFLLIMLLICGIIRGNPTNRIIHEAIVFFSIPVFLFIGIDDNLSSYIIKLFTITFWLSVVLCFLTYDNPAPFIDIKPWEGVKGSDGRYTNSIAYFFFRQFTHLGLPLFIIGWIEKKTRWHYLQINSIIGYVLVNVMIFKFRGALIFAALASCSAIIMPTKFTRKVKLLCLAFVAFSVLFLWIATEGGKTFEERMDKFNSSSEVLDYRIPETMRYLEVMGYEWLWGRGLGATFQYDRSDWGRNREGVHIGWVTFTLKGGLPLLFFVLSFFIAWFRIIRRKLRQDPYFLAACFWAPILFVNWLVNPISIQASSAPVIGFSFLLLARFGLRK
jgi:hypothetical protein